MPSFFMIVCCELPARQVEPRCCPRHTLMWFRKFFTSSATPAALPDADRPEPDLA